MSKIDWSLFFGICLFGGLVAAPASASGEAPVAVSPGSPDAFSAVGSSCPTFSWGAVDGATGYELVVYAAPEAAGSFVAGGNAEPVIRARIPGRALSWTPAAGSCLALSGSYAWSVRALDRDGGGEWSGASLFRVEPAAAVADLAAVLERALGRYLESRGLSLEPDGRLAAMISEELAGGASPSDAGPAAAEERALYRGGMRYSSAAAAPEPEGVFVEDVELWLEEDGSGEADQVQLVFATPEFDGQPPFNDAWSIVVNAEDTASPDDGKMFFSTPGFTDALQLFTDGSAVVPEQRHLVLRRLSSPPFSCTGLQEGSFYWDDSVSTLCVCDGSSWEPIDSDNTSDCI